MRATRSIAVRAALAIGLMAGFYLLALGIVALLLAVPVLEVRYLGHVTGKLTILSVFPQFIDRSRDYGAQFALLVLTYSLLVVLMHCGYALTAQRAKRWLTSERGGRMVNRAGGAAFVCFGAALATARR